MSRVLPNHNDQGINGPFLQISTSSLGQAEAPSECGETCGEYEAETRSQDPVEESPRSASSSWTTPPVPSSVTSRDPFARTTSSACSSPSVRPAALDKQKTPNGDDGGRWIFEGVGGVTLGVGKNWFFRLQRIKSSAVFGLIQCPPSTYLYCEDLAVLGGCLRSGRYSMHLFGVREK
jgi:hypothetical protein